MRILSVHLRNIKSHRDTELSFCSGINVLSGLNGAGKSTIFEAIGYALFGVDARDFVSNIERFLTIGQKKGEIRVVFEAVDGSTWRVSRTVGAGVRWLLARETGGVFEIEEHAGIAETEARVAGLLGLANGRPLAEQFKQVIGPFQNDFLGPFVIRQPTRRQEAFDEILGIDAWRKTYKGTAAMLSALQERTKVLEAEVTTMLEQLSVLPERQAELATLAADQVGRQQTLAAQAAALQAAEQQLAELERCEKSLLACRSEVQVLDSRIGEGEGKVATQKQRVDEAERARGVMESSRAGHQAYLQVEERLRELRQQEQARRQAEQQVAALEKEALRLSQALAHEREEIGKTAQHLSGEEARLGQLRQALQADPERVRLAEGLAECRELAERLKGERALLEGRREALVEGRDKLAEGVCPFLQERCPQFDETTSESLFSSRESALDSQIRETGALIDRAVERLQQAEQAAAELQTLAVRRQELDRQIAALEEQRARNAEREGGLARLSALQEEAQALTAAQAAQLQGFADLDSRIERAEQERAGLQAVRDAFHLAQQEAGELPERQALLDRMRLLLEDLKRQRGAKQADLERLVQAYDPERHHQARLDKDRLTAEVAALGQQLEELGRLRQRVEGEVDLLLRRQEECRARQAEAGRLQEKEKLVKFLRNQVFKHVSAQLSERFREEIGQRADCIYRTIAAADEELHWGDNYQIVLRDCTGDGIRERSDDQLSGGQMMSAVVALRLALLQTIGARIAFFDEPTSNLDASRRENLAQAFRAIEVGREEVTEHWYDQLFLISHDVAFTEITDQIVEIGQTAAPG